MIAVSSMFLSKVSAQDDFTLGTSYYLISLDDVTAASISPADIAMDLRVDEAARFLYVWDNTYTGLTAAGPNWNGEVGAFTSLAVGTVGWSGLGFAAVGTKVNLSGITSAFTFHIAMKSTSTNSHVVALSGGAGLDARLCIGATAFVDGANTYQPYANFARDGKWHLIEIPMTAFFDKGLKYPEPFLDNYFYMLSGGTAGTKIDMDAIFIYKKKSAGINNLKMNELSVLVTSKTVSVVGATDRLEVYTLTGKRVLVSNEPIFDVKSLAKGIYVIKSGGFVSKFVVR